jgi:hypothetical protein
MCDNLYCKNKCPAKCGPGFRELTDYRPNVYINEQVKYINGLNRDDEYRMFLQNNGEKLMNGEWTYLKQNNSCFINECIFDNKHVMVHPTTFDSEMKRNNELLNKPRLSSTYQCKKMDDFRLTK